MELSGAFTTALILSAILAPFVGRMVERVIRAWFSQVALLWLQSY
jgi:hypothetical protein